MEVGHDKEADSDGDNAEKFDVVVGMDAVCDIVADLLIENDADAAGSENDKADDECAKIKRLRYII